MAEHDSPLHEVWTRTKEALLARTLIGRRLDEDVRTRDGALAFARGTEIDRALLDRARDLDLLEPVAAAAEPGTSDTELEELLVWLARRRGKAT
jgi:hypothetical protein